jgi:photosystem II stability/assembly factor-like uncharacterized protein
MRTFLLCLSLIASNFCAAQWTKLDSGTDASFRGVSAVDANVCWVSGSKGTVLRTTDGGKHWTKLPVPNAEKLDFRDVEAFDASTAIIMSAGPAEQGAGKIFKTTDAGSHWKEVLNADRKGVFFDSMAFWDKQRGIVFSDPVDAKFVLYTTIDGGDSWQELHPDSMPPALPNEGAFAASGTAIAVAGKNDVWFGTGGASVARVFHSSDHGKHWTVAEVPIAAGKASAGVFGVAFKDPRHGVAVGGDYLKPNEELTALAMTGDGGKHWKAVPQKLVPLGGVVFAQGDYFAIGNVLVRGKNTKKWKPEPSVSGYALSVWRKGEDITQYVVGPKGAIQQSWIAVITVD